MDGITVLKSYEAVAYTTWGWSWVGFVIALMGLAVAIGITYLIIKEKSYSDIVGVVLILFLSGLLSLVCFNSGTKVYEPRYDVYIHGTINMDEFNEKYRVIDQDGLIYTITENTTE